ncbi:MAG TPA: hypothetical protein VJ952_11445 [Opitutales bacterium]|nr:hypothetical protein [Opitutales bacterium]
MPREIIDSALELISSFIRYELGSAQFYVVLAACVIAWLIVARILMGLLKSDRGFMAALLALALPLFFGLLAYGVVDWQVVARIEGDWAEKYLPPAGFGLVALLVILVLSSRVFVVNGFVAVFIFAFASAAAVGAYFAAEIALETLEKGSEQIEQREERSRETIESVL